MTGFYQQAFSVGKAGSADSLASGILLSSLPEGMTGGIGKRFYAGPWGYMLARITGTCTAGDLLYQTGPQSTNLWVTKANSGDKPIGIALGSPTVSGQWHFMAVDAECTVQITNTVSISNAGLFGGDGSAAYNNSAFVTGAQSNLFYIGKALSDTTASSVLARIKL